MGFTVGGDAAQVLEILYPDIVAAAPGRLWHKAATLTWAAPQSLTGGLTDSLRDQALAGVAIAKEKNPTDLTP